MDIKISQLQTMLYMYIKKEKPLMIHGPPGIGKSDSVRYATQKIAKEKKKEYSEGLPDENKYCLIDVRISQLDPSDLRGIPFPEGNHTRWLVPNWLPQKGEGVLFFDEINLAPPSIQAACYQLILDRRLGDYILPKGWTIISAGNRSEDNAAVFPMSSPLKNRFSHVTLLPPSEEEWTNWAMENGIKSDIIAFINFKLGSLYKFDPKSKEDAFPTPRTWALTSHMTHGLDASTDSALETEFMLAHSCVGSIATEYHGYLQLKKRINIHDILKNPKKVHDIEKIGIKYTLIAGLSELYKHDRKKMEDILKVVKELDSEFGVFLLRLMRGLVPKYFKSDLMGSKSWEGLFEKYKKYIF